MSRYIDADALTAEFKRLTLGENSLIERVFADGVYAVIETFPTADVVEVKHGEWGFDGMGWTCSQCGEYALSHKAKIQVHSVYCPNCGAKMDGERREE